MIYLQMLQSNIRRYGWQSFILKVLTILIVTVFITIGLFSPAGLSLASGASLRLAFGVVLCIFLWLGDGHNSALMESYGVLYQKATQAGGDTFQMTVEGAEGANVKALWRPLVVGFYIPMMSILVILSFLLK
jgi:hypothetical protein